MASPPRVADELDGAMLLEPADAPGPDLLGQAVDDLDAGEVALVDGAVEGLAGEGLLVDAAVGVAVEEAAQLVLQLADALDRLGDERPGEVLVRQPLPALDRVHEVALDRVARGERHVVAALDHARAAALAEQALDGHRDREPGVRLLRVQRREEPRAARTEDEDVGLEAPDHRVGTPREARTPARRVLRLARHLAEQVAPVGIHADEQRAESTHAELPQRLRIHVVEVHVLDRLDPGGLQGGGPADDGQVGAAQFAEGGLRVLLQAALADDEANAVLAHERAREALHARRGGRADADRLVARRELRRLRDLAHVGRGVDDGVAARGRSASAAPRSNISICVRSRMPKSVPSSVTVSPTRRLRTCSSVTGVAEVVVRHAQAS